MTTRRTLLLLALLAAGLSTVFVLPRAAALAPAAVRLELPAELGAWTGRELAVSDRERESLGPETAFAKRIYTNSAGEEVQVILVLSGSDMNTSIHRPERCLPAQGWTITGNTSRAVPLAAGGDLPATRLTNVRSVPVQDGRPVLLTSLAYYWFVGAEEVTGSHVGRSWIDLRDRILAGTNQRWAYATVSAVVTDNLRPGGRDGAATDALLQEFIAALWPQVSLR